MTLEQRGRLSGDKAAAIIESLCDIYTLSIDEATSIFYNSETSTLIDEGVADLHCRSPKYLAQCVWDEYNEIKKTDNALEMLPIVDVDGTVIGTATRGECHAGTTRPLHPVVHLHVFDEHGRLYLQQRPTWKDIQPGKWDTSVGGHVDPGESIDEALRREAREELGIEGFEATPIVRYVFESDRERELVNSFRTVWHGEITPSDETAGGRFWTIEELTAALGQNILTPNFEQELKDYILPR